MRFEKAKVFLICGIVAVSLTILTALFAVVGFTGPIRGVLKTVAKPLEWCGTQIANAANGFAEVFTDYDRLVAENEELRRELAEEKREERENALLKEENAWLKEYLEIADTTAGLRLADARIIGRTTDNYSTVLTLNRGSVHGVRANMPVLTPDGVFGYVKEAGLDWCKVVSLLETVSSVGAYTGRTGVRGVVQGDVNLRAEGRCLMTYLDKDAVPRLGDLVYTAGGEESNYPPDLLIGEIVDIIPGESGLVVEIQPAVDFSQIDTLTRLMVICGYTVEE